MTIRRSCLILLTGAALCSTTAFGGKLEREIEARWRGAFVVAGSQVTSNCNADFTRNRVNGAYATGKGRHTFEPGELGQIVNLHVHRSRIDVQIAVHEPRRVSWYEGPFELFDHVNCRIELEIEVPREEVRAKDYDALDGRLAAVLTPFRSADLAMKTDIWNGRQARPFPENYDDTLFEWSVWKAERYNASVDAAVEAAIEEVDVLAGAVSQDPEYLDGFAAGLAYSRKKRSRDCTKLIGRAFNAATPSSYRKDDAGEPRGEEWLRGFTHGRSLTHHLSVLSHGRHCYVEVPERDEMAPMAELR